MRVNTRYSVGAGALDIGYSFSEHGRSSAQNNNNDHLVPFSKSNFSNSRVFCCGPYFAAIRPTAKKSARRYRRRCAKE